MRAVSTRIFALLRSYQVLRHLIIEHTIWFWYSDTFPDRKISEHLLYFHVLAPSLSMDR